MDWDKVLIVKNKLDYARGKRPPVACILCAVAANDPEVDILVVYRGNRHFITLNLYPYNPGHVMVVPFTHHETTRTLDQEEVLEMHALSLLCMEVLEQEYKAQGFNVGFNLGPTSGASIPHLHQQIVPRYPNEIGFFEIFSEARVIVEDPQITRERMDTAFQKAAPVFFENRP